MKLELGTPSGAARRGDLEAGSDSSSTKDYTTAVDINPHYITPKMLQFRLQKIMDEYVAGVATYYNTNDKPLGIAEEKLEMLKQDSFRLDERACPRGHRAVPGGRCAQAR